MYLLLKNVYYMWASLVLVVLIIAIINAIAGKITGKVFESRDLRVSLFGLILLHIQFLIGLILYFISPWFDQWSKLGMRGVIIDAQTRLYLVEYPFTNILAIVLITIGWSLQKYQSNPGKKFLRIALFYGFGLLLLLSRVPWDTLLS